MRHMIVYGYVFFYSFSIKSFMLSDFGMCRNCMDTDVASEYICLFMLGNPSRDVIYNIYIKYYPGIRLLCRGYYMPFLY